MRGRVLLGLLPGLPVAAALAAGGHHAVDDAAVMEPGQCQLELWLEQAGRRHSLQHLGPACRVGAVEMGLDLDRSRIGDAPRMSTLTPQLKWATDLAAGWSVGAVWSAGWSIGRSDRASRYVGQVLLLPLSWQPDPALALHLNLGREFRRRDSDLRPRGAALEWQPLAQWQGLAEYFHDGQQGQRSLGLRYLGGTSWSLDLSRTRPGQGAAWWTLGLNLGFGP